MLAKLLNCLDRRPAVTLSALLLAILAAGWFIPRLTLLDSPERWMPQTTLETWDVLQRHFDVGDNVGIGLHFLRPVSNDDLPRLKAFRKRLQAIEGMNRVYDCSLVAEEIEHVSLLTLINATRDVKSAEEEVSRLQSVLAENPDDLPLRRQFEEAEQAATEARRFEIYSGALWDSPPPGDPTRMLMTVCELTNVSGEDNAAKDRLNEMRRHVSAEVKRIIAEEQRKPHWQGVEFHAASGILMMSEMEKRATQVALRFLPLSLAIGLISLLLGFRSFRAVVVTLLGSGTGIVLIFGALAAGGGTLGVMTMAAPAMIAVIATASTIHFAAFAVDQGNAGEGAHRKNLVRWVCVPCLGAAITTGVGFLMLWFNELAPIRDLGWQMFAGSLLAFLGVFVFSRWIPIRRAHSGSWITPQRLGDFSQRFSRRPFATVLVATLLVAVLCFFAWPRPKDAPIGLHVDTDPFSFFSDEQPIKIALKRFSEHQFAVYQLEVVLVPKRRGRGAVDLSPPDEQYENNLLVAERFSEAIALRKDLGVMRVLSTLSFRRRYEQFLSEMSRTRQESGWGTVVAQFFRNATSANVMSHSFRSWNVDKQDQGALRFTVTAHDDGSGFDELVQYVKDQLPEDDFHCYLAGSIAQSVDLARGLSKSVILGLGLSLAAMGLLCVVLFRSPRLAAIAALPNLFPVLVVFGLMGMFKAPISSGSAMVATVAMGIALNDTIHFMMHYRERTRGQGLPVAEAVTETMSHVGRPIILTSLVHIAGFAVFLCTDFVPLYHFGLLGSIAMLAALVGDLILLPNLLLVFDRSGSMAESPATLDSPDPVDHVKVSE